ncbi:MAG: hypothetical protein WBC71_07375 [Salaquimonas sp.]
MSKAKKSNKEARKPKQDKKVAAPVISVGSAVKNAGSKAPMGGKK